MDFQRFVIEWNNLYPLDRWFRKKYNIRFNSTQHRGSNLIDIYFEFIEDKLFDQARAEGVLEKQKTERYKKNGWLEERKIILNEDFKLSDSDLSLFDEHD